ncbi:MAG: transposase [Candidatus Thermoplasmatota archaeon]|nr:transposase [Candidatus Thermoplasmatota archaeon]
MGDITRFPLAKKLARYAGLTPRMKNSGKSKKEGGISKEGSKVLRWILVSAVHSILRCRKGNNRLKNFYLKLIRRKKSKAVVATAKKLLQIIYAMLTKGEEYKEGDDGLAFRKLRRMEATAVSVSVIPKDIKDLKMNIGKLRKKVDILGGGYAVK